MRASAYLEEPTNSKVVIQLTGTLGEFEVLRQYLSADAPVPFHAVMALIGQIDDATRKLRGRVTTEAADEA